MKIIICGVGRVGLSIASYLSMQDYDITVIDANPSLVKIVSDTYDIQGIVGNASEPAVLKKAGADDANIIIAVTDCDEINMVACQAAHSIFGIQRKIARIRNDAYRDPAWSNMFSRNHMPIDIIISPEEEIAEAIINRMSVPGTTNDISLADHKAHLFGLIIDNDNQIVGQSLSELYYANKQYDFRIVLIIRNNQSIIPAEDEKILDGDEIYILCEKSILMRLLDHLGNNNNIYNNNIVIAGGGVIGEAIAKLINKHDVLSKNPLVIIEQDRERAYYLNRANERALILNESALNENILKEASVENCSVFVSVMNSNENNILSSVLAKKMGAQYAISLSTNRLYNQLLPDRFIDAIVNPETITVSRILTNLRRGHIISTHSIRDNNIEFIEAEVTQDCAFANMPLIQAKYSDTATVAAVFRPSTSCLLFPGKTTIIKPFDIVMILAEAKDLQDVEKLFSYPIKLFN